MDITEDMLTFQCNKCPRKFVTERLLILHTGSQHEATECKLCYRNISDKKFMQRHLKFVHKNESEFWNPKIRRKKK